MKSTMTTERMIEQTEKQIELLEKCNELIIRDHQEYEEMGEIRANIILIRELSEYLYSFNRTFKKEGLGENKQVKF